MFIGYDPASGNSSATREATEAAAVTSACNDWSAVMTAAVADTDTILFTANAITPNELLEVKDKTGLTFLPWPASGNTVTITATGFKFGLFFLGDCSNTIVGDIDQVNQLVINDADYNGIDIRPTCTLLPGEGAATDETYTYSDPQPVFHNVRCTNNGQFGVAGSVAEGCGIVSSMGTHYTNSASGNQPSAIASGPVAIGCETEGNANSGILFEGPWSGTTLKARIAECTSTDDCAEPLNNGWGLIIRKTGGSAYPAMTQHSGTIYKRTTASATYRNRDVCGGVEVARLKLPNDSQYSPNIQIFNDELVQTSGDQTAPGVREWGHVSGAVGTNTQTYINLGIDYGASFNSSEWHLSIHWDGDSTGIIEDSTSTGTGGEDGTCIGFDSGTNDGIVRNCAVGGAKTGVSFNKTKGGTIQNINVLSANTEADIKINRCSEPVTVIEGNGLSVVTVSPG